MVDGSVMSIGDGGLGLGRRVLSVVSAEEYRRVPGWYPPRTTGEQRTYSVHEVRENRSGTGPVVVGGYGWVVERSVGRLWGSD